MRRSVHAHEMQRPFLLIGETAVHFDLEAGRNKDVQKPPVQIVRAHLQGNLLVIVQDLFSKNPFRPLQIGGDVAFRVLEQAPLQAALHDLSVLVLKGPSQRAHDMRNQLRAEKARPSPVGIHGLLFFLVNVQGRLQRLQHVENVLIRDDPQLPRVFHVNNAVADIVGGLQQIGKRMAAEPAATEAQRFKHLTEDIFFRRIIVEFF